MDEMLSVDFIDMRDSYSVFADIACSYRFKSYRTDVHDRIAILKLGWQTLQQCLCSIPATPSVSHTVLSGGNMVSVFPAELLRDSIKDFTNYYQFCYVSAKGDVQGISAPFRILNSHVDRHHQHQASENLLQLLDFKDKEIAKLRDENGVLRESLKVVLDKNMDKAGLERKIEDLRNKQDEQQKEIEALRMKLDKMEMKSMGQVVMPNFDDLDPLPPCPISFD